MSYHPNSMRSCVYIVSVPDDFRPERPWQEPREILRGYLYIRNVTATQAAGFARVFNKRQLEGHLAVDRQWALCGKSARVKWDPPKEDLPRGRDIAVSLFRDLKEMMAGIGASEKCDPFSAELKAAVRKSAEDLAAIVKREFDAGPGGTAETGEAGPVGPIAETGDADRISETAGVAGEER